MTDKITDTINIAVTEDRSERDSAREYFYLSDLSYKDINYSDYLLLLSILQKRCEKENKITLSNAKDGRLYNYLYSVPLKKCKYHSEVHFEKGMSYAEIPICLDLDTLREGITFNKNKFISFAGWADDNNVKIFTEAFCEWVDIVSIQKVNKSEEDT